MTSFWIEYQRNARARIALRVSGKAICKHPGCVEPVAPRERRHGHHAPPDYCVEHTPTGGWEHRGRKAGRQERANARKKDWRARARASQAAALQRMGEAGP